MTLLARIAQALSPAPAQAPALSQCGYCGITTTGDAPDAIHWDACESTQTLGQMMARPPVASYFCWECGALSDHPETVYHWDGCHRPAISRLY
jgi:hypothetical protein